MSGRVRADAGGWISGPSADLAARMMPWTTDEVAQAAGVEPRTIYRWLNKGWIRGFKTSSNGHWRFPHSEVLKLMRRMGFDR